MAVSVIWRGREEIKVGPMVHLALNVHALIQSSLLSFVLLIERKEHKVKENR